MLPFLSRRMIDRETFLAPCYTLILTPEELKSKYPQYYKLMEELRYDSQIQNVRGVFGEVWRLMPRIPFSDDFLIDLKIPGCISLECQTSRRPAQKIVISSVQGPNSFAFQLYKHKEGLKDLEEQMRVFYQDQETNHSKANYVMATGIFEGSFYAVFSHRRRKWVRCSSNTDGGVVTPESVVSVTLLDYACIETVTANRLRPLIKSFTKLPAQGYSATLFDCYPPQGRFNAKVCQEFREKILNQNLYAHVVAYRPASLENTADSGTRYPHVVLYLVTATKKLITLEYNATTATHTLVEIDDRRFYR